MIAFLQQALTEIGGGLGAAWQWFRTELGLPLLTVAAAVAGVAVLASLPWRCE
jgi:drug/metabolite transporter superfamily protein YnfA